jgi:hypothetical protein
MEGNANFCVAAGGTGVHRLDNLFEMQTNDRPLLVSENDQSYFSARQVLLITDVLIRAQKDFVVGIFSVLNQLALPSLCQPI